MKVALLAVLAIGMANPVEVLWLKPGDVRVVVIGRDAAPLSGVSVTLLPERAGVPRQTMVTNSKGRAGFVGVRDGDYTLRFVLSGFATCSIGPIRMRTKPNDIPQFPELFVMMNPVRAF